MRDPRAGPCDWLIFFSEGWVKGDGRELPIIDSDLRGLSDRLLGMSKRRGRGYLEGTSEQYKCSGGVDVGEVV